MSGVNLRRLIPFILLAILIASNLFTAVRHLGDLPCADEPQFYDMGKSIWQTGLPYAYSGDLWHPVLSQPLLYHHLLALISQLGLDYWGPRLLGLLLFTGGLMLALATARRLGKDTALWVAILMLAPPLVMQGALLVDIDGGLMVFITALWAYIWLGEQKSTWGRIITLGLFVALGLSAKLLVPALMCGGAFIAGLLFRRKEWMRDSFLSFLIGAVLLAGVWFIYTALWQIDFMGPFTHGASKALAGGLGGWAVNVGKGLVRIALWMTPVWLLLMLMPGRLGGRETPVLFAGWLIFAAHAGLGVTAFGFPKYFPPMIPLLAIGFAPAIQSFYEKIKQFIPLLTVLFISILLPLLVGDPLLPILTANRVGMDNGSLLTSAACLLIPLLLALALWAWQKNMAMLRMALVCVAVGLGSGIMIVQGMADYEVRYIYGERGMCEMLSELEKDVPTGSHAILPVDVAFLSGYHYQFRQAESALQNDATAFTTLINDPNNQAIVLRESYYAHMGYIDVLKNPTIIQRLENEYRMVKVGSFTLYYR
jgi:4-amino-4-deoxy-L-arabinose transferase-like glycosyltransferase